MTCTMKWTPSRAMYSLIVFVGFSFSMSCFGARPNSVEAGLSWMSYQMMSLTTSSSGKKDTFGTSFYHLALQYHQPVSRIFWSPWLRYMPEDLHSVKSPNKSSKTSILAIGTPLTWNYSGYVDFSSGPLLSRYTVRGYGSGAEILNNGEGTSEFFQPDTSRTATSLAWQFGAGWTFDRFRATTDILVYGLLSSKKRTFSSMLTGCYVFGK